MKLTALVAALLALSSCPESLDYRRCNDTESKNRICKRAEECGCCRASDENIFDETTKAAAAAVRKQMVYVRDTRHSAPICYAILMDDRDLMQAITSIPCDSLSKRQALVEHPTVSKGEATPEKAP